MYFKKVLTYGALVAQNNGLKQELSRRNFSFKQLSERHNDLIRQLGIVLQKYQTKSICTRGHYNRCNINHDKYNYVKPMYVQKTSFAGQHQKPQATKGQTFEEMSRTKLIKKIDRLQCVYRLPPPSSYNTTQDLVFP